MENSTGYLSDKMCDEHRVFCDYLNKNGKNLTGQYILFDKINFSNESILYKLVSQLGDAPAHIRDPQIKDLQSLSLDDFCILYSSVNFVLVDEEIKNRLQNQGVLSRLLKRYRISEAINEADKKGAYDAAEHQTSKVCLK